MYELNITDVTENILSYLRRLKSIKKCLKDKDKTTAFSYRQFKEVLSEIEDLCEIKIYVGQK